jgi:hypothetical protein
MNIAFFGASITQQKTGYVSYFKELNKQYHVQQFGYGGMNIRDGGIIYIDDVIRSNPEYCFLDWFSPECYRPPKKIDIYVDVLVEKLLSINCYPIFLFFYRKDMDRGWFDMFEHLRDYAQKYSINSIDLSQLENASNYLRDSIHTNDLGSKKYASIINERFHTMTFQKSSLVPEKNSLSRISSIELGIEVKEHIKIKSSGCSSIVGVLQQVGPYSDMVICCSEGVEYGVNLKDKWSERYERETIKFNIGQFCSELVVKVKVSESKKLVWEKLFYTGDIVELVEYV